MIGPSNRLTPKKLPKHVLMATIISFFAIDANSAEKILITINQGEKAAKIEQVCGSNRISIFARLAGKKIPNAALIDACIREKSAEFDYIYADQRYAYQLSDTLFRTLTDRISSRRSYTKHSKIYIESVPRKYPRFANEARKNEKQSNTRKFKTISGAKEKGG